MLLVRVLRWLYRKAFRRYGLWHQFDFVLRGPDGRVLRRWSAVPNRLFNAGELLVLQDVYQAQVVLGTAFYGRLYNQTPVDTDTLITLSGNEMRGFGYGPVAWVRGTTDWATPTTLGTGEGESIGAVKSYTASGGQIGPFTYFVFATTPNNTGAAFAYAPFGTPQTIAAGASLQVRPRARLRGVSA